MRGRQGKAGISTCPLHTDLHTGSAGAKDPQVCAVGATAPDPIQQTAASDVEGPHLQSQDGQWEALAGIQARRERPRELLQWRGWF